MAPMILGDIGAVQSSTEQPLVITTIVFLVLALGLFGSLVCACCRGKKSGMDCDDCAERGERCTNCQRHRERDRERRYHTRRPSQHLDKDLDKRYDRHRPSPSADKDKRYDRRHPSSRADKDKRYDRRRPSSSPDKRYDRRRPPASDERHRYRYRHPRSHDNDGAQGGRSHDKSRTSHPLSAPGGSAEAPGGHGPSSGPVPSVHGSKQQQKPIDEAEKVGDRVSDYQTLHGIDNSVFNQSRAKGDNAKSSCPPKKAQQSVMSKDAKKAVEAKSIVNEEGYQMLGK